MVKCIDATVANLEKLDIEPTDVVAIGLASQRCNAIAWDKITGALVYPGCIMAADIRTQPLVDELKKVYSFRQMQQHHTKNLFNNSLFDLHLNKC